MMQLVDSPTKLRILHVEDSNSCQSMFCKMLQSRIDNVRVKTVNNSLKFYSQLPFENPHLIVVDWVLEDGEADYLLYSLMNFKGEVIFFSSIDEHTIKNKIISILGCLPKNFEVIKKNGLSSYRKMIKTVKAFATSIGIGC